MSELYNTTFRNDSSLVSYFQLEGNSTDYKASNSGSDTAITYASSNGRFNSGAGFNGTTSFISLGTNTNIACTTGGFTISLWMMTTDNTVSAFAYCKLASSQENFGLDYNTLNANAISARFYYGADPSIRTVNSSTSMTNNVWYHTASTYDGANLLIYVNGVLKGTTPASDVPTQTAGTALVGQRTASSFFWKGGIDDLAFFSRTLSATEINQLYLTGLPNNYQAARASSGMSVSEKVR